MCNTERRQRSERIRIWVTVEERAALEQKVQEAGYGSISAYAREMLLHGNVQQVDFSQLIVLNRELGNLNRNLHQIVYRAALLKDLHEQDYNDILTTWEKMRQKLELAMKQVTRQTGDPP